jgi:hypothetical protein
MKVQHPLTRHKTRLIEQDKKVKAGNSQSDSKFPPFVKGDVRGIFYLGWMFIKPSHNLLIVNHS